MITELNMRNTELYTALVLINLYTLQLRCYDS